MARRRLADDTEMNRDMLSRRLARHGHVVIIAVDGQCAIDLARAEQPDLVLMDMNLPVLDGWEATRRLRVDPATRLMPVIALTAHAMLGDREKAMSAGCNDYATKPVDLPRLLDQIDALLAR
jgi:two-component system, cell cycle response regulator DivK